MTSQGAASCSICAKGTGRILVKISGSDAPVCECSIDSPDAFTTYTAAVTGECTGLHTVWIVFEGRGMSLDSFRFHQ